MAETLEFNLCPLSNIKPKPAFATQEEYERFRVEFREAVEPDIKRYAEARFNSEQRARHHFIR